MRAIIVISAILCFSAITQPEVFFETFDNSDGTFTIAYTTTEGELPQAVTLKITCNGTMVIESAVDWDPAFNCYPDYCYSQLACELSTGYPLAHPYAPGVPTLPATEVSICMGVLDQTGNQGAGPAESPNLITLAYSGLAATDCGGLYAEIMITADTLRGPDSGVVAQQGQLQSNLPTTITIGTSPCYPYTDQDYNEWISVGCPSCWCCTRQCYGDAACDLTGNIFIGYTYVGLTDFVIFARAWDVKEPPHGPGIDTIQDGICADFAHDLTGNPITGYTRVGLTDLTIFAAKWDVKEPPDGPGIPGDCAGTILP